MFSEPLAWAIFCLNMIGSISDFTVFSFQAIKHLTTGDGGYLSIKNHELIEKILKQKIKKKRTNLINQVLDLALLSQGMLKGEELTSFIYRSVNLIK